MLRQNEQDLGVKGQQLCANCHQRQSECDRRMWQQLQQGTWRSPANRRAGWTLPKTASEKMAKFERTEGCNLMLQLVQTYRFQKGKYFMFAVFLVLCGVDWLGDFGGFGFLVEEILPCLVFCFHFCCFVLFW